MASSTGFHLLRTGYICPGHEARVLSATANHCTESTEMCNGQGVTTTKHKETSECRKHKKQEQALREEEEKGAEICEVGLGGSGKASEPGSHSSLKKPCNNSQKRRKA